jgi:protein TonB
VTAERISLYDFMPYGAPELKEVARKYMVRAVAVASAAWFALFMISFGTNEFLKRRPHEERVIIVPYRELQAPPPLTDKPPPPKVEIATPVAPPTVGVAVPVPDAEAPPEQTIASQEEIAQSMPGSSTSGDDIVVAPPSEEELPQFGQYVYTDELPELITKVPVIYPDIAREAGVEGKVLVQALVGKDGRVKDTKVVSGAPMLKDAAESAVKQYVFKPALANNKPVACWVAIPISFSLH